MMRHYVEGAVGALAAVVSYKVASWLLSSDKNEDNDEDEDQTEEEEEEEEKEVASN